MLQRGVLQTATARFIEKAACRSVTALSALVASPVFAVSAVPVVVSAGAAAVAVRACAPSAELAVVVYAEFPVACGHQRRAVVVFAVPAGVSGRCAAAPEFAAGGADRAVAAVSVPAWD